MVRDERFNTNREERSHSDTTFDYHIGNELHFIKRINSTSSIKQAGFSDTINSRST